MGRQIKREADKHFVLLSKAILYPYITTLGYTEALNTIIVSNRCRWSHPRPNALLDVVWLRNKRPELLAAHKWKQDLFSLAILSPLFANIHILKMWSKAAKGHYCVRQFGSPSHKCLQICGKLAVSDFHTVVDRSCSKSTINCKESLYGELIDHLRHKYMVKTFWRHDSECPLRNRAKQALQYGSLFTRLVWLDGWQLRKGTPVENQWWNGWDWYGKLK